MALPTSNKKFEDMGNEEGGGAEEQTQALTSLQKAQIAADARAEAEARAEAAKAAESKTTAVAAAPKTAVAQHKSMDELNPFKALENVFPVKFNTLTNIQANQGNFIHKDTSKMMGDTIVLELVSTQKHWVLSPGGDTNDDESLQFVKYSEDGITSEDGLNMREALIATKEAGYDKAKISERTILVGCLLNAGKAPDLVDQMVQIDLAPTSAAHFARHQLSTAFGISKGKMDAAGQTILKMECTVKNQKKLTWTEVVFSQSKG